MRSLLPTSFLIGGGIALLLKYKGFVAPNSNGQLALLAFFAGVATLACLLALLGPVAFLSAFQVGIRFEKSDKAKIAIALAAMFACCPPVAWVAYEAIQKIVHANERVHAGTGSKIESVQNGDR